MAGSCLWRLRVCCLCGQFNVPYGIAMWVHSSPTDTDYVYIADKQNHLIRAMTAVCSKVRDSQFLSCLCVYDADVHLDGLFADMRERRTLHSG